MVMISMCLAGIPCRYDGGAKDSPLIRELDAKNIEYQLFCPECMGGMSTPREPAEIVGGTGSDVLKGRAKVINRAGEDVTREYVLGAQKTLELAEKYHPEAIYMKSRSPSCGKGTIYDGTFSKTQIAGDGVTAALLSEHGYHVVETD